MIRIVHIITGLRYGGAEKLLYLTCKWMAKLGAKIDIVYFDPNAPMRPYLEGLGVECLQLNRSPRGFAALVKYLRQQKYDVIHTHLIHADILGRFAALLSAGRIPVFTTVHGTEWFRRSGRLYPKLVRAVDRWLSRPSNHHVIAISQAVFDLLISKEKISPAKISVLYNAVEIVPLEKRQKDNSFNVLYIGRLSVEKNIPCLIQAVAQLGEKNIKLTIVGDGDQKESLEKLVGQLNLEAVVTFFNGCFDVDDFYRSHNVLVLPSRNEGLGLVILEGFRFALPVIGSNVDGIAELLGQGRGLLFENNNSSDLAEKLSWLHANPDQCAILGKAGYDYIVHNHNIENYVENLLSLYLDSKKENAA